MDAAIALPICLVALCVSVALNVHYGRLAGKLQARVSGLLVESAGKEAEKATLTRQIESLVKEIEEMKNAPVKKTYEISAADLLHDLTTKGSAILHVNVMDPTNLILRSPRT